MREIGGYIEFETYHMPMLHREAVALNCGRNALAYLLHAERIQTLWLPKLICDSVIHVCAREGVAVKFYSIDFSFQPAEEILLGADEWLYLVNYYGQMDNENIDRYVKQYRRVIVDQAQSYFQKPLPGVDTIYTCRKFFGVADGAFLYTVHRPEKELPRDESFERMHFLLGRYERTASEFYGEYVENNHRFAQEPVKRMSKLTENLLCGIDYIWVKEKREQNFACLHGKLEKFNRLDLVIPEGPFMYPLYIEHGAQVRKKLQAEKMYIPTLWPNVFDLCGEREVEHNLAKNILPLPVDQRYGLEDMAYLLEKVCSFL